jgi:DNA-binding LacI/PurR family transcriptional regulator
MPSSRDRFADDPSARAAAGPARIQMADIARMAGVSIATVSRALSGSPLIQAATRERIEDLARSLNYQVNAGAASLRRRDVSTVGVVILEDRERPMQAASDPFVMGLVGSLADALAEKGQDMLLARYQADRRTQLATLVDSGRVAGLIVMGQWSWHDSLNDLARRGVPMAVWGAAPPGTLYPVVGSDNERGGHLATQHLLQQGCRRLGFLGDRQHPEVALRHAGFLRALNEAGLAEPLAWQHPIAFEAPDTRSIVAQWASTGDWPDGVFVCSDLAALTLMRALADHGVPVPQRVKVVGYDDIPLAAHTQPSLTTVSQPFAEAGRALVHTLGERLEGRFLGPVVLATELRLRESTARI